MEVAAFLSALEQKGLRPHTIDAYRRDIAAYREWYCSGKEGDILCSTPQDIRDYFLRLRRKKKASATRARYASSLRSFFEWEKERGRVPLNPVAGLKGIKVIRKDPSFADFDDVERLKGAVDTLSPRGLRDLAMIELCVSCGMGVSELLALRLCDVDIKGKIVTVGARHLRLAPEAIRALRRYLDEARPLIAGPHDEERVFLSLMGRPITRQGFWKNLRAYCLEAGAVGITPETLRHSYAVHAFMRGESPESVTHALGLRSPSSVSEYAALARALKGDNHG